MAILSTGNILSEQRWDAADQRRVESAVRNDFDTTVTSIITNTSQGYIIRGFTILTSGAIGSSANDLQMSVDPGAVLNINASVSGTIFQTPIGTPNQTLNAAVNTNVTGSFAANSTNYVGIDYNRFADPSTNVSKYIWNASANNEIPEIAPASQTLTFQIYVTTSTWAVNVLPVAIVTTDSNGNVVSITDARWMLYSLGTGGLDPNPNYVYPWSEGRTRPAVTTTSDSVDPFVGGDKQLDSLKAWMNAVMTTFLEIKGTPDWFTGPVNPGPPPEPLPSLQSIFQDLGNTVVTGSGEISNGILPNSDPVLVTTGTIASASNQLTALASTTGIVDGLYVIGTGIPQGTTVLSLSGSTVTLSNNATLNGTGIGVSFYSASAITAPGQINWDQPINIRVIGSSLTYVLAANPSSTDITLSDDEVAYVTLVREVPITPNLIFVSGSPTVNSVGNVAWTSGLLAGDYIKVASDTSSGYYKIQTVNSSSQVTLTTNVSSADNTGSSGAQAEYAFGSYQAALTPSTNRNIYIASRESVPINGDTFWLFMREDNGGSPRVYVRFLGLELDNGESLEVSGTTSQQLLQYIGAASAASSAPQYVGAVNPGSIPTINTFTLGAGSTISAGEYFYIYSSANARQYAVWFSVNGAGSPPVVANINSFLEISVSSADSANTVATEFANAFNSMSIKDFSAVVSGNTVTVTNTSAGTASPAANYDVGAPFAIFATQAGTGNGNYVVQDGASLTLAIKELDSSIGNLDAILNSPAYDEVVSVVASGATPPNTLNGPVSNGTTITLPDNSRISGTPPAYYTVGKGILQVFLNGQFIDVESGAYTEIGTAGAPSNQIEIISFPNGGLSVGDELEFRFSGAGGAAGGGGVGPAGAPGPAGPRGFDSLQGPVSISTKNANYSILSSDCFLLIDCTSGDVTVTLPTASSTIGNAFYIKKIDSTSNSVTIATSGSDLIDGQSTQTFNTQYVSMSIISSGTWNIF